MNKFVLVALILSLAFGSFALPGGASAESQTGKTVVTLGADLSQSQRQSLLQEMNVDSNVETIDVSIADIRNYLHGGQSGGTPAAGDNKAYSSARITLQDSGNGIQVKANNVTRVTEQMYANALLTAGIQDAQVYVTSPEPVTGTAALTGIMMAFEKASNKQISQEQRQVANEEMKRTSELGQQIGDQNKAADFMNKVKEEIAKQQPKSEEEVRQIVVNVAGDLNINLNNQQIQNVTNVMHDFSKLDIDWGALSGQLDQLKGNLQKGLDWAKSEEAQGFFDQLLNWLSDLFSSLKSIFS
ncbi:DUF1002 domain-containing protein [Salinithrix halophila]|uniref:DUF1002 domain-containing protein n=1 Tax=Salinithrix halophila TaxID=1485204 RepID=A0ABV8JBJ1_9BACL